MVEIITRAAAKAQGKNKYFTGAKCRNGHLAERYVQSATCEECIRESRQIIIAPTNGEVLPPITETSMELLKPQSEITQQRLELIGRKLSIEERKLALKELRAEDRSIRLQDRAERKERQYRQTVKRSRLVNVCCCIHPLDYEKILAMIWAFAYARDPLLRPEDLVTNRQMDDGVRRVMLCFPQDKEDILRVTNEAYQSHFTPIEQERDKLLLALNVEAEGEWPESDPK